MSELDKFSFISEEIDKMSKPWGLKRFLQILTALFNDSTRALSVSKLEAVIKDSVLDTQKDVFESVFAVMGNVTSWEFYSLISRVTDEDLRSKLLFSKYLHQISNVEGNIDEADRGLIGNIVDDVDLRVKKAVLDENIKRDLSMELKNFSNIGNVSDLNAAGFKSLLNDIQLYATPFLISQTIYVLGKLARRIRYYLSDFIGAQDLDLLLGKLDLTVLDDWSLSNLAWGLAKLEIKRDLAVDVVDQFLENQDFLSEINVINILYTAAILDMSEDVIMRIMQVFRGLNINSFITLETIYRVAVIYDIDLEFWEAKYLVEKDKPDNIRVATGLVNANEELLRNEINRLELDESLNFESCEFNVYFDGGYECDALLSLTEGVQINIEYDGGIHLHRKYRDAFRDRFFTKKGVTVIRVSGSDLVGRIVSDSDNY